MLAAGGSHREAALRLLRMLQESAHSRAVLAACSTAAHTRGLGAPAPVGREWRRAGDLCPQCVGRLLHYATQRGHGLHCRCQAAQPQLLRKAFQGREHQAGNGVAQRATAQVCSCPGQQLGRVCEEG